MYFSGTNCRTFAWAVWDAEGTPEIRGIRSIALYLAGELANLHLYWDHFPETDDLAVMFDSTHIPTYVPVRVEVLDTEWELTTLKEFVPVRNHASIFGRRDLEGPDPIMWLYNETPPGGHWLHGDASWGATDVVDGFCSGWNYTTTLNTFLWANWHVLQEVRNSTVFYVNTHGAASNSPYAYFQRDLYDYYQYYPEDLPEDLDDLISGTINPPVPYIHPVLPERVEAIGYGLPPFNHSLGNPPITLAFLDGCALRSKADEYADGFLFPEENIYSNGLTENQAVCAYLIEVEAWATRNTQEAFWGELHAGGTVFDARREAHKVYMNYDKDTPDTPEEWMVIAGDPTTRLHGVYTATIGRDTRWVRTLW